MKTASAISTVRVARSSPISATESGRSPRPWRIRPEDRLPQRHRVHQSPGGGLAAELAALAPGDLDKATSSPAAPRRSKPRSNWPGSTGWRPGKPSKHKIIALFPAYHGNTLLALSASAREHYKTYYREWLVDVVRIPAPYSYRCECGGNEDRVRSSEFRHVRCPSGSVRARGRDPPGGTGECGRLHRRTSGRQLDRSVGSCAGIFPPDSRNLRQVQGALHRR